MRIPVQLFSMSLLIFGAALRLSAQSETLTLPKVVAWALDKSPDHRIAKMDQAAAAIAARQVRTPLLPQLSFDETITRGNDPVYAFGTRLRQQKFTQNDFALNNLNRPTPIGNFTTRFSGSWTAFDSWRTQLRIRQADMQRASTDAATTRADQQLVHRVIAAYESVLLAARRVEVTGHETETAAALLAAAGNRVEAGMAVDADRLSAASNLAARQQEQIAAEGDLAIAWAELEQAVGVAIPEEQRAAQPFAARQFDAPALSEAVQTALRTRPDRMSLVHQQDAARVGVSAARAGFGPTVSTFGSWETDRDSLAGSGGNNWLAGMQVKIDIFPMARRDDLAAAKIAENRAQAIRESADSAIRTDVTRSWYSLQSASKMLAVAQSAQAQSEESLRILRNRYDAGLATVTDLLRAQDAERENAANYWQFAFRNTLAWVDLRAAMGTLSAEHLEELQ